VTGHDEPAFDGRNGLLDPPIEFRTDARLDPERPRGLRADAFDAPSYRPRFRGLSPFMGDASELARC
jgi:hypothetical protein